MKLEFDGAISIDIPTEDELSSIYDTIKATMQKENTFELMAHRPHGGGGGADREL